MANTKTARKKSLRPKKTRTGKRTAGRKATGISAAHAKEMVSHISDATMKQFTRLGKTLGSAKDKEAKALKDVSEKVRQFANKAMQLTKLKIEIHNLKEEHDSLLKVMGENLWNMNKANNLSRIKSKLKYDFHKLKDLEAAITEKKKTATRITTFLKNIR